MENNSSGSSNAAVGFQSLKANTTGSNNIAFGNTALLANNTGSNNVVIGTSQHDEQYDRSKQCEYWHWSTTN
jgi:hypothetical protein